MDCERALRAIAESIDEGKGSVPDLDEALAHCAVCDSCRVTARGMAQLAGVPAPKAPEGLADRVMAAVDSVRAEDAALAESEAEDAAARERLEAARVATGGPYGAAGVTSPSARARQRWGWQAWAGAAVSAAAVLAITVGVAQYGLRSLGVLGGRDQAAESLTSAPTVGGSDSRAAQPYVLPTPGSADAAGEAAKDSGESTGVPSYVTYDGYVWRLARGVTADRSSLSAGGRLYTDLGTGAAGSRDVYERRDSPGTIFVEDDGGTMVGFTLVTRTFEGGRYALAAARGLEHFGEWPTLPASLAEPAAADGSPTFAAGAADDLGVTVYPLAGRSADGGFAIAPGTSSADPAAGNPNWTWWEPYSE